MEIMSKTILRQIITQCAGTQDIFKKLASCDLCARKSGLKTVAFLLRLSIVTICNFRVVILSPVYLFFALGLNIIKHVLNSLDAFPVIVRKRATTRKRYNQVPHLTHYQSGAYPV